MKKVRNIRWHTVLIDTVCMTHRQTVTDRDSDRDSDRQTERQADRDQKSDDQARIFIG